VAVARCDLLVEDCIAEHIAPRLDGRRPTEELRWNARCPACDSAKRVLTVSKGTAGQRIVWNCHRGCIGAEVKRAMLARRISPGCIPWKPDGGALDEAEELRAEVQELRARLAEVEKIVIEEKQVSFAQIRLRLGMVLWPSHDAHQAAERLGIGWRTAYRVLQKLRREQP
jgi:hypothetical protein